MITVRALELSARSYTSTPKGIMVYTLRLPRLPPDTFQADFKDLHFV